MAKKITVKKLKKRNNSLWNYGRRQVVYEVEAVAHSRCYTGHGTSKEKALRDLSERMLDELYDMEKDAAELERAFSKIVRRA